MVAESRIPNDVLDELRQRGHDVQLTGPWANGKVMGVRYDKAAGVISGAASAKNNIAYAMGW